MGFRIKQTGSMAAIAFGAVALVLVVFGYVRGHATADWPAAEAEVISCGLERVLKIPFYSSYGQGAGGRGMYDSRGRIVYRYAAQGREHISDDYEIGFLGFVSNPRGSDFYLRQIFKLCEKYRPGLAVEIYYDPSDPSSALIKKGYRGYLPTYLIFILAVIGAGVYGILKR